mmetsp:Transcript_63157/g.150582  ORF Transcript_63157/g.150582 Transcript_63157/m.150582 type:complete len:225 (+) Transcript_63157:165-839(+)|eukprot:CAMPEP_0178387822 /NCGR_PEP_ID=MMETSP0689_2-20121128/9273_1 /TAXON_ID=160604 /ORGANISM="Amphidinium massartii, Strain CS-259" /LENGTH=224 /DNA_ID=CAMNT_0020008201 /DNA_START=82 /DNA_END=756 /DNA_ORIENTATION=+
MTANKSHSRWAPPRGNAAHEAAAPPHLRRNVFSFFHDMEDALKEKRQELDEEEQVLQAKRRQQRRLNRSGSQPAPGLGSERCGSAEQQRRKSRRQPSMPCRPGGGGAALAAGASLYLQEWTRHDQAWEQFQASPPCPLSAGDVPWPPCGDDVLEFCEKLSAPGHPKQAYRIACRRWHPDKFLQLYGSLVVPEELPLLTQRLNETFQAITREWDRKQTLQQRRCK